MVNDGYLKFIWYEKFCVGREEEFDMKMNFKRFYSDQAIMNILGSTQSRF